jgi:hypothetical protein
MRLFRDDVTKCFLDFTSINKHFAAGIVSLTILCAVYAINKEIDNALFNYQIRASDQWPDWFKRLQG